MADVLYDGKAFVSCPTGGLDFGKVSGEGGIAAGIRCGPIRLQVGYPGSKGFGFLHIQAYSERVKEIAGLGYKSVAEFCAAVGSNFTIIGAARDGRIVLVWKTSYYDLQLIVQWQEEGYWTIVTGIPTRVARKFEKLCGVMRTGESEPTPNDAKRSRFATLSLPKKISLGDNGS